MHQVIATAGHVDHGKSALIQKLTGTDPDRFEEEKRRGLTIDLGFAWMTLPSGSEVGFVDVPGHERFIHNMLAGVGPVRLVLFVVAADEGWKPQTEEHLAIIDLLGVEGAVVALTRCDLAEPDTLEATTSDVRERLQGTALAEAPMIVCSARTGAGMDDLVLAIDTMVSSAAIADSLDRPRLFVDRVFTVKGAGTVVTGTLAGGSLSIGDEMTIYPGGRKARIRGLQSHRRAVERTDPTSRVAVNLSGVEPAEISRGDMLGVPDSWKPTALFEAYLQPVRSLAHPLTQRGAFKVYAGSMERDASIRFYSDAEDGAFARIRLAAPATLDVFDHVVIRESGRGETVAGGIVLDVDPPARPGTGAIARLTARLEVAPDSDQLGGLLLTEKGAVRPRDFVALTGALPPADAAEWLVSRDLLDRVAADATAELSRFHEANPLKQGADLELLRRTAESRLARMRAPRDPDLVEQILDVALTDGLVVREGASVRLPSHDSSVGGPEFDRLLEVVEQGGATPPTIAELVSSGFERDLVEAACNSGPLTRISPELVMTTEFIARARQVLGQLDQITVSSFRETLGTSRKYAVPLLEYFDGQGVTTRRGDVRTLRS